MFEGSENINSLRKSFAIKRAKDLAENARILIQKDKQIEELKHNKTDSEVGKPPRILSHQDVSLYTVNGFLHWVLVRYLLTVLTIRSLFISMVPNKLIGTFLKNWP